MTGEDQPVADPTTGEIRILAERCKSCILNPAATRIQLTGDRLREFIADANTSDSHVVCHRTLDGCAPDDVKPAICRGHADAYGLPHRPARSRRRDRALGRAARLDDRRRLTEIRSPLSSTGRWRGPTAGVLGRLLRCGATAAGRN